MPKTLWTFTLPTEMREELTPEQAAMGQIGRVVREGTRNGGTTVAMRMLTGEEVLAIIKAFRDDDLRATQELCRRSIERVNGEALDPATKATWWGTLEQREVQLLLEAYTRLHTPSGGQREGFFESMTVTVVD